MVLFAGSRESGKTTFLARLGEMFRDGSFRHFSFAGSLTLWAFERATWRATIASGSGRPQTPRTSRVENDTFYHLRVVSETRPSSKRDILISDLAGETFPTAVASREFCLKLAALGRADHLAVLIDCDRLINQSQRHTEIDNVRLFLQRVIEVRQHNLKSLHVQVVFSRWDRISKGPNRAENEAACKKNEADLNQRYGRQFASLDFARIAARPDDGIRPTNTEIQALFAKWLETPLFTMPEHSGLDVNCTRDFSAFRSE